MSTPAIWLLLLQTLARLTSALVKLVASTTVLPTADRRTDADVCRRVSASADLAAIVVLDEAVRTVPAAV